MGSVTGLAQTNIHCLRVVWNIEPVFVLIHWDRASRDEVDW